MKAYLVPAVAIGIWYFFNVTTLLFNKYLFKVAHFNFPFTLTFIHMFLCSVGALLALRVFKFQPVQTISNSSWMKKILPLSVLFCANIILGNVSLSYISVPFMQTIKSSVPAFSALLSYVFLNVRFSTRIYLCVALVVCGVAASTLTELEFEVIGFTCALLSSISTAAQSILISRMLSGEDKLDSMNLLYQMAPLSAIILIPFVLGVETFSLTGSKSWLYDWDHLYTIDGPAMLVISGMIAFALNIVTFLAVKYTSPLTLNVAGNFKVVFSIAFSVLLFGTKISLVNAVGCVVALIGVGCYNYFKAMDDEAAKKEIVAKPLTEIAIKSDC
ncbi:UDP-galactose transporter [Acrasis kona]|uniref:UDP-galactose transporter n=1 Tax=Acrasis kona TaxID=1008807 RepID=A0AAW2ZF06_9EUKA